MPDKKPAGLRVCKESASIHFLPKLRVLRCARLP